MSGIASRTFGRLIFVAALLLGSTAAQASLQEGIDAFHGGNHKAALERFTPLANNGNAVAQFYLGKIYMQGLGAKPDYDKAMSWTRKSAKQNNSDAENFLGFLYYYGLGTPQSYTEAMSWYRKAADAGHVKAQTSLGMMFVNGQGVTEDPVQAYKWLKLAELAGEADAGSKLRAVEEKMTEQQLKEGQALVQKWKPVQKAAQKPEPEAKPKQKAKPKAGVGATKSK